MEVASSWEYNNMVDSKDQDTVAGAARKGWEDAQDCRIYSQLIQSVETVPTEGVCMTKAGCSF